MAYSGSDSVFRKGIGLAAAALLAPFVTTFLVLIVPIGSLSSLAINNDALISASLMVGLFAMLFGFVGAALFLGAAFWLIRRATTQRAFVLAGVGAGIAHSSVGLLVRIAFQHGEALGDWLNVAGHAAFIGGFLLMAVPDNETVPLIFAASALAGALSGLVYARIAGAQHEDAIP